MRVLLLNQVFYPDVAATAQHADDLARHLVRHGHEVHAIASRALYGQKGAALPKRETVDGVEIHRVGKSLFGKAGILARVADFGLFYLLAIVKCFTIKRPDVVVCFTTPPFIALVGRFMRLFRRTKYVYWVMDLYPDLPVACGVMKPSSPVTRFFEGINRYCLRKADRVVVLGRCMLHRVRDKGVDRGHVQHIGVWSDANELEPVARADNPYTDEWGLGDTFVVMYSGNFGLGHDVDTFLRAAERLRTNKDVRFLFVGGGKKKEIVDAFVEEKCLENCVVAPYQPRESLGASLSSADVHLATLLEGVEGIMVPCKLFGIMGAGKSTIFIGNKTSELARVLDEYDCGHHIDQGDVDGLVTLIERLAEDRAAAHAEGVRAREALSVAYSREAACERWRLALEDVVNGVPLDPSNVEQRAASEPIPQPESKASA
ncbi:MAG: glycosyltransferase family 4 protein [Planctomycetota bacterium]